MTDDGSEAEQRPIRVLAWPAFRKQAANPHAALLASALQQLNVEIEDWSPRRALTWRGDLWHIHHPDTVVYPRSTMHAFLGTLAFEALLRLARSRGIRIIWTVHDVVSNDALHPRLEKRLWRYFVPRVDAFICLTQGGVATTRTQFPSLRNVPGHVVPHGHYRDAVPHDITREAARAKLDLPAAAPVLLAFGRVRPYKGLPALIKAFRDLDRPGVVLLIAGDPNDQAAATEVESLAADCPGIRLHLRWIAPEEVQTFFVACDAVVLPYRRVHNSGALFLAMSFARPVLVPDIGNMRDNQAMFGEHWVTLYDAELDADDLRRMLRAERGDVAPPDLSSLGWDTVAQQTKTVYQSVIEASSEAA